MSEHKKDATIPKNKGGRPPFVFTDKQVIEIEELASDCMSIEEIADHFGIVQSTFALIKNRDIRVFEAYKRGKRATKRFVVGKLREKIKAGDGPSIMFYLKTQEGWREKQDLNLSNDDGSLKSPNPVLISFADDSKKD